MTPEDAVYWYEAGLFSGLAVVAGPLILVALIRMAKSFLVP